MNSVSRVRAQMQLALLIEAFRRSSDIPELTNLAREYSISGDPEIVNSSIKSWEDKGYLIVSRTLDGFVFASLRQDYITDALEELLNLLNAETFKVDWLKEEILTDSSNQDLIPAREGWKLFALEKSNDAKVPEHVNSASPSSIQIVNNFTPNNTISIPSDSANGNSDSSGWWNLGAAIIFGIVSILVALWIAGKI